MALPEWGLPLQPVTATGSFQPAPILVTGILLGVPLLLLLLVSCPSGSGKVHVYPALPERLCLQLSVYTYSCLSDASSWGYWSLLDSPHQAPRTSSQPLNGLFPLGPPLVWTLRN